MTTRKLQYAIDYIHVLTFKDYIRDLIAPYFDYELLEYAIDNENTLNESARLIFKVEGFGLQFKKDGVAFVFEGDASLVKKSGNPVLEMFFKIFNDITRLKHYSRTTRHRMTLDAVRFTERSKTEELLYNNPFIKNPFGKLTEFASVLIFNYEGKEVKLQVGNYFEADIKKYDLTPLKTKFNQELFGQTGLMAQITVQEAISSGSFSKFKDLLNFSESTITKYLESTNNE
jgi:hypothetical protein